MKIVRRARVRIPKRKPRASGKMERSLARGVARIVCYGEGGSLYTREVKVVQQVTICRRPFVVHLAYGYPKSKDKWQVSEPHCGRSAGRGKTKQEALSHAELQVTAGRAKIPEFIEDALTQFDPWKEAVREENQVA